VSSCLPFLAKSEIWRGRCLFGGLGNSIQKTCGGERDGRLDDAGFQLPHLPRKQNFAVRGRE